MQDKIQLPFDGEETLAAPVVISKTLELPVPPFEVSETEDHPVQEKLYKIMRLFDR